MRNKLGDLAATITQTTDFGESAPMPLDSTTVEDHIESAVVEGMSELKTLAENMYMQGDRYHALMLQNVRLAMKAMHERYTALRDKDDLERRHLQRPE
jgi:hypothetical protein